MLLRSRQNSKHLTFIKSFIPYNKQGTIIILQMRKWKHINLITCSDSPNWFVVEPEFEPKQCSNGTHGLDNFAIFLLLNLAEGARCNCVKLYITWQQNKRCTQNFFTLIPTSFTYPLTSGKERMGEGQSACYQCWPLILEPWVTYTVYLFVIKYNSGSRKITHSSTFNVRPKTTSGLFRKWVNPGTAGVTKRGGIYHRSCITLVQRTHGFYPTLSNGVGPEVGGVPFRNSPLGT